ncbi:MULTISPECIES: hypothetical protein [unclassified Sphingobium]|uniref:hypothetical protein n=1 Tax=unclassified Sphingobium TaxID=2611147 RepID=UPI00086C504A|nr:MULTISPECIES: hypothetical protein [unclassified Sphingobium]ODU69569.1 MAG: hypothetical protein ABT11_11210 [Novosphingobium sp. SCN 66-18]CAH0351774.1 hypothetical protein SPH9361_01606 [Sphingobium sp. CECT 9361]
MTQGKTLIIVLVTLIIGFGAGFVLRPVISPVSQTAVGTVPTAPSAEARGTQYFAAHLDEARQVVAQCADDSARGEECANAQAAVTEAEGRARFKKFMGN